RTPCPPAAPASPRHEGRERARCGTIRVLAQWPWLPAKVCISSWPLGRYPDDEEAVMAKTLVDVNEEYLAAAQEVLHTETKKDTINAALRAVAALAARRRDLPRLVSGGLPDLEDAQVMRAAWRR